MLAHQLNPDDINSQSALMGDRAAVVAFNQEMSEGEFASEWSADRFVIGNSPIGDTYYLDLTGDSLAVFFWDHETHEVSSVAISLDIFIAAQREQADDSRMRKGQPLIAPKPWWQFRR